MTNMKPQMLIVGSTGFLGSHLLQSLFLNEKYLVVGAGRSTSVKIDLGSESPFTELQEYLSKMRPEYIVITAAAADVELCAKDPIGTRRINVTGVKRVLEIAALFSVKPIFFSSDYALRPLNELHHMIEEDECLPQTEYGRQKHEVEMWIEKNFSNYLIFRTSKLVSLNAHPKNMLFQIVQDLKTKESLHAVDDQWFTPVFIEDIAKILAHDKLSSISGVFHLAAKTVHTRYDLALQARELLGLVGECDVKPISKSMLKTLEERPRYNTLSGNKISDKLDFKFLEVENSLFWRKF